METKKYTIQKNHTTGTLAIYELHKGQKLWIKDCIATNKKDAEKEFIRFSNAYKKEYIRLGGDINEFPQTKIQY